MDHGCAVLTYAEEERTERNICPENKKMPQLSGVDQHILLESFIVLTRCRVLSAGSCRTCISVRLVIQRAIRLNSMTALAGISPPYSRYFPAIVRYHTEL